MSILYLGEGINCCFLLSIQGRIYIEVFGGVGNIKGY
jgi:hypothetical protein